MKRRRPQPVTTGPSRFNDRRDFIRRESIAGARPWFALTSPAELPRDRVSVRRFSAHGSEILRDILSQIPGYGAEPHASLGARSSRVVKVYDPRRLQVTLLQAKKLNQARIAKSWEVFRTLPPIPRQARVCLKRAQRREVLFAKGHHGINGSGRPYRRSADSSYHCRG